MTCSWQWLWYRINPPTFIRREGCYVFGEHLEMYGCDKHVFVNTCVKEVGACPTRELELAFFDGFFMCTKLLCRLLPLKKFVIQKSTGEAVHILELQSGHQFARAALPGMERIARLLCSLKGRSKNVFI